MNDVANDNRTVANDNAPRKLYPRRGLGIGVGLGPGVGFTIRDDLSEIGGITAQPRPFVAKFRSDGG